MHDDPLNGLADVVFLGFIRPMGQEFGVVPDGRLDLPVDEAYAKAVALDERRFVFDFRPLSHLWQVMAGN